MNVAEYEQYEVLVKYSQAIRLQHSNIVLTQPLLQKHQSRGQRLLENTLGTFSPYFGLLALVMILIWPIPIQFIPIFF